MPDGMSGPLLGLRVLVVEDVAVLAWLVRDVLTDAGAQVAGPVPSVAHALALLAAHDLDAAVLDMNLDGEPADPVANALAARDVPFLFVTGYGPDSARTRYPGRPILCKPVRAAALVQAVAELAGRHAVNTGRPAD